jgi:hypothetical protein
MYPQTGFDTHFSYQTKNFICFFGGGSSAYNLVIDLVEGDLSRSYDLEIINDSYGQMHVIWLEDLIDSSDVGLLINPKCSIHHDLKDVYPRFYVGILNDDCPPTLTHTFFDTSRAEKMENANRLSLRVGNQNHHRFFDSAFIVPIFPTHSFDTALQTYGQNLSFSGDALLTIYTMQGEGIYSRSLSQAELSKLIGHGSFNLSELLHYETFETDQFYCLKLAFVSKESPFPKRFKMAFNLKRKAQEFGTNICFSPLVISQDTFNKPFNRRWFPVGGSKNYIATVHNTALEITELSANRECDYEFVNHLGETLVKRINVKGNQSVLIDVTQDIELNDFLGKYGGWCMVTSKSYLTDAYYFSMTEKQIGGDHAY